MGSDRALCLRGGLVWQPDGTWQRRNLWVRGGRIVTVARGARTIDARGWYIAPGFIDLHLWGGPVQRSRELVRNGTTGFLITVGPEAPRTWLARIAAYAAAPTDGAALLGLHLEGPYINRAMAGALPRRALRPARPAELRRALTAAQGRVRLVTLAPEAVGARDAIRLLRRAQVAASLGHTAASFAQARDAIEAGARSATHLLNRMRPPQALDPGTAGAALLDERVMVQLICDGVHVAPEVVRLAVQVAGTERVILVTDAVASGRGAVYRAGRLAPARRYGLPGLAGSTLTMMQAVRNVVRWGAATLGEAIRMASLNPARLIGVARRKGGLEAGQDADLVVFDRAFRVQLTMAGGRVVYQPGASRN